MYLRDFSNLNRRRCSSPEGFGHKISDWSTSDWLTATVGELGEAANLIKKLNRVRDGIKGNTETEDELKGKLAEELADVFIYLDLLAQSVGVEIDAEVVWKFNKTSRKVGYPEGLEIDLCGNVRVASLSVKHGVDGPDDPKGRGDR